MPFFKNIQIIARVESKTLMRSWFLRIFAIIALLFLFFFNIAVSQQDFSPRVFRGLPTNIPYATLQLFNVAQAIIAVFLASDFMKRDKKQDTTEVIYVRSLTNGEYIWGKVYGNLRVFVALNLVVLIIPLIFTLVTSDMTFDPLGYGLYFLLISIPTLIFIFGLSFFLMAWIRNQAVVLLILLGYIALTLFYLNDKLYYIFDYMSFNIPMIWSEFTGLPDASRIILHKILYISLGISLVFFTVILMKRLRQSNMNYWGSLFGGLLFLSLSIYLTTNHVGKEVKMREFRTGLIELNDQYLTKKLPVVDRYNISMDHQGSRVSMVTGMELSNPGQQHIDTLIFSLNPALKVKKCLFDGQEVSFEQQKQILLIQKKLAAGDSAQIKLHYEGHPDERVCHLDVPDRILYQGEHLTFFRMSKKFSFLTPDYLMFTPELLWYPVPGTGFSTRNVAGFRKNFAHFQLTVTTSENHTVISQGEGRQEGAQWIFRPDQPLNCLSVVAGDYQRDSLRVGNITYNVYIKPGHDIYRPFFNDIQDTIPSLIEEVMGDYASKLHLDYPFDQFSIVEVPAHFYAYRKNFTLANEASLPQMVMMQERAFHLNGASFSRVVNMIDRRRDAERTPEEQKAEVFRRFIQSNFIEGEEGWRMWRSEAEISGNTKIFPNFVSYCNDFGVEELPVMNPVLERYIESRSSDDDFRGFRRGFDIGDEEKANMLLDENSLAELMSDTANFVRLSDVIDVKGSYFIHLMKHFAGASAFDPMLDSFILATRYQNNTGEIFLDHMHKRFNVDTDKYMNDWLYANELPAFLFHEQDGFTYYDRDRLRYQSEVTITNTGQSLGLVMMNMRIGRRRDQSFTDEKTVLLEPGQTKRVALTVGEQPSVMVANTLVSSNMPSILSFPLRDIEDDERENGGAYIREVERPNPFREEIIIDNENSSFRVVSPEKATKLRDFIRKEQNSEEYTGLNFWRPPEEWQKAIHGKFYGEVKLSASYIRSGEGDYQALWMVPLEHAGYYDVQVYVSDAGVGPRWGRRQNRSDHFYQYTVYHDDGEETIPVEIDDYEGEWVSLGEYYFSPDSARIQLSNQSEARAVVADAVKLIRK